MDKKDAIVFSLIVGTVFPMLLFLTGWWGSIPFVAEKDIFKGALFGLCVGLLLDAVFLKQWIQKVYDLRWGVLILIYLFYTIGIFGFFMGFPVFTVVMGPIAGYYIGKRAVYHNLDVGDVKKIVRRASLFAASVMAAVCSVSAVLALSEKTLPSQLTGMLNLPFVVTWTIIWGIIVVGGMLLTIGEYWMTKLTIYWICSRKRS